MESHCKLSLEYETCESKVHCITPSEKEKKKETAIYQHTFKLEIFSFKALPTVNLAIFLKETGQFPKVNMYRQVIGSWPAAVFATTSTVSPGCRPGSLWKVSEVTGLQPLRSCGSSDILPALLLMLEGKKKIQSVSRMQVVDCWMPQDESVAVQLCTQRRKFYFACFCITLLSM